MAMSSEDYIKFLINFDKLNDLDPDARKNYYGSCHRVY